MATVAEVIATPITEEEVKVVPEAAPEPGADVRADEEFAPRAEKKEKEKEEKPRSLAAFKVLTSLILHHMFCHLQEMKKNPTVLDLCGNFGSDHQIMKDMERWAKIQNRQKETVRAPSPLFKSGDDQRPSKAADAAFAIFERKVREPFSFFSPVHKNMV